MHVFEFYRQELYPLAQEAKRNLPGLLRVEREVRALSLPRGHIVLDLETTGLEPEVDEIVSYGIVAGSRAWVVIRLNAPEEDLIEELKRDLEEFKGSTIWAFYSEFEWKWLVEKVGGEFLQENGLRVDDLKQMRGRLTEIVPYDFGDPFDGSRIPGLWRNWQDRASLGSIAGIIHHNMADILREAFLWALLENGAFGGRVNEV
ncbi:hypothetical protein [Pyrococcus kukulkanii]|uniref:hypothetical protein n=1 Tax=Pyrococcus kukulkanii TaxID=1609559 RepID=UPI003563E0A2